MHIFIAINIPQFIHSTVDWHLLRFVMSYYILCYYTLGFLILIYLIKKRAIKLPIDDLYR